MVVRMRESLVTYTQDHNLNKVILLYSWVKDKLLPVIGYRFMECFPHLYQAGEGLLSGYEETDCYIRFWNSHGHPHPYRNQSEAENCLTLSDLCKLSDIHREAADLIMKYKIQLNLGRRSELVSLVMNAGTEVKAGIPYGNNTETIRKVRQLLQQYNLTREEIKAVDNAMEVDQPEYNNQLSLCSQSTTGNHVDLWPLHDHMFVISELKLVNEMMTSLEYTASTEIVALVNYGSQFTPVSPMVLAKLKAKCEDKSQEAAGTTLCEILCDLYQQLWTNTSATGLNWWLNWSPSPQSMASSIERTRENWERLYVTQTD
ncbi:uncharacterized protein LOC134268185 [Saccostrea cucullata]|uniref:uncharacterized protein LOC134268185 n=1 Tax=Saccostrea cuccullata TaxID=36930 RepID=UPI002ED321B0